MNAHRALLLTAAIAGCGDGGGFPDAPLPEGIPPGGSIALAWRVTDMAGADISCDSIGGQAVTLTLRDPGVSGGSTEVFGCGSKTGTTPLVAIGTYDIGLELNGTTGLLATAPTQPGIRVKSNETTALAPTVFAVNNKGGLALRLDALATGGNCAATTANGAGISNTTLTLTHTTDGTCQPVTLAISAGATGTAQTYSIDCTAPVQAPCLASDQVITASGVTADQYQIHVRGLVGGTACYSNNDSLVVPPNNMTLTRTLNLGHSTGAGC